MRSVPLVEGDRSASSRPRGSRQAPGLDRSSHLLTSHRSLAPSFFLGVFSFFLGTKKPPPPEGRGGFADTYGSEVYLLTVTRSLSTTPVALTRRTV